MGIVCGLEGVYYRDLVSILPWYEESITRVWLVWFRQVADVVPGYGGCNARVW